MKKLLLIIIVLFVVIELSSEELRIEQYKMFNDFISNFSDFKHLKRSGKSMIKGNTLVIEYLNKNSQKRLAIFDLKNKKLSYFNRKNILNWELSPAGNWMFFSCMDGPLCQD